ncbi:SCO family protein [soil metagenome]
MFAAACVLIASAVAISTVVVVTGRERGNSVDAANTGTGTGTGQPLVGGPFQLVDQDGKAVDQTLLDGKWTLVFFGFTYCPDFCPTTLTSMAATKAQMGDKARDLQIAFITVDPARDTPKALKDYLASDGFPAGVIGLTGTPQQIADVARAYRAYYQKVGEGEGYTMNHSLTVYLMGPDGKFRAPLAYDLGPQRSAQLIERIMARG